MKLSSINLNLLIALDALLDEQSVSKAAARLNLSQSQLSNILKDLRILFEDDLLVKGPDRQMVLTSMANSLILPVNEAINKFKEVFKTARPFKPETANDYFGLGMNDYTSSILCNRLIRFINEKAPNISMDVFHLNNIKNYHEFKEKNINLAIGSFDISSNNISREMLYTTKFTCAFSNSHKLEKKQKLTKANFLKNPIILISSRKNYSDIILKILDMNLGKNNYRCTKIPHFYTALNLLKNNNYICIANKDIIEKLGNNLNLSMRDLPFQTPELNYYMFWKKVDTNNPAHKWFRTQIKNILK
ncbi:MAG TPA: LysR family transcriptional regulator [Victivallales bacterium]|nr:LysR family transcriptional regulator [Victivallales bacterium]